VPTFAPFDFVGGPGTGSFEATGTTYIKVLYPVETTVTAPTFLAFDTITQQYVINITTTSQQIGLRDKTYFINVNPLTSTRTCHLLTSVNYTTQVVNYAQALERSAFLGFTSYTGVVKDPGTCGTLVGASFIQDPLSRILQWNTELYISAIPGVCVPSKLAITFTYDSWKFKRPDPSVFQLDPLCDIPLTNYCEAYYPCDVVAGVPF
jgi:hypothetical protein